MLYIVGMGLELGDMTLKGLKAASDAEEVFVEDYTSFPYDVGMEVTKLKREDVEGDFLVKKAKKSTITLLVPGDPLFATTHASLVQDCRKAGVGVEVIHAPSVVNALARTGLSSYKFGRIVTLSKAFDSDKKRIGANVEAGLHTLCLLDPAVDGLGGLAVLESMGFSGNFILCERLGTRGEKISYGAVESLVKSKPGPRPHCIIIPGELHFFEKEFLQQFSTTA